MHLYGVVIYYFSSLVDILLKKQSHCRPEARYVWGYFIGGNIPWLIVPACKSSRCQLPPPANVLIRYIVFMHGGRKEAFYSKEV
jgi:hypothetical protein